MTLSIRLDEHVENQIRESAAKYNVSVSEYVRMALVERLERLEQSTSPYEAGKALFGRYSSLDPDLAAQAEERLRESLNARHRR